MLVLFVIIFCDNFVLICLRSDFVSKYLQGETNIDFIHPGVGPVEDGMQRHVTNMLHNLITISSIANTTDANTTLILILLPVNSHSFASVTPKSLRCCYQEGQLLNTWNFFEFTI